ncbi:PepSY domain-containing protein [Bacillus sp. S/N-304-OC-R1]|uniref:PepSY domain-containing protein n=1 Tax=Bacillus sp. S/N-304-OC-R1 TaxID=2758034 RepID=UPI001C8E07C6|nr:PepSY domain-containing protein [Bacillus sp. S/N-304-OC-R1]MBY0123132.1 PepSY domain-containing protein [Bacillus sp. S/N-304-OC-R1]
MKHKLIIGAVSAAVILGGAVAAGAAKNDLPKVEMQTNSQKTITHDEAIKIALSKAVGQVESVELENGNGKQFFEVDIKGKTKDVEVRIDAQTGKVLSVKADADDSDDFEKGASVIQKNYLSVQKAIEIAQKEVNGKVIEIKLDEDDNKMIYEIELKTSKGEAELELDAVTGKVLDIEYDHADDDNDK